MQTKSLYQNIKLFKRICETLFHTHLYLRYIEGSQLEGLASAAVNKNSMSCSPLVIAFTSKKRKNLRLDFFDIRAMKERF